MTIATTAKQRRQERRAQEHQVACCCAVCVPRGRRWPANYVGNGMGAEYAGGDSGPLVAGISYDDYLANKPMYVEGHAYQGRPYSDTSGSTLSPSAAAIAHVELYGELPEREALQRDKREMSCGRLYAGYMKQGWRYLADERRWLHTPENPPTKDEVKAMLRRLNADLRRADTAGPGPAAVKRNTAAA